MEKLNKITIDKNVLENLCGYHAKDTEISAILKIELEELKSWVKQEYGKPWHEFYKQFSAKGKLKIRENQMKLSSKSSDMAKYLGEKYLEDNTKPEQISTISNTTEQSLAELSKKTLDLLQSNEDFLQLPVKRRSFLVHYLATKNAHKSAELAGYSERSAAQEGARMLKNDKIKLLIAKFTAIEADLASDEKEELIRDLKDIKNTAKQMLLIMPGMGSTAVSAIKTIAELRGFNAPVKADMFSIVEILKTQEDEGTINLD